MITFGCYAFSSSLLSMFYNCCYKKRKERNQDGERTNKESYSIISQNYTPLIFFCLIFMVYRDMFLFFFFNFFLISMRSISFTVDHRYITINIQLLLSILLLLLLLLLYSHLTWKAMLSCLD
jgi:hypothetical protein